METDNRQDLEIELSDEDFLCIAKMAHERDITFNKMVEEILWQQIKRVEHEQIQRQSSTDQP